MIAEILNFDPLDFLLRLSQNDIIDFNPNDLASDLFKEILQANLVQYAFNVCINSIKNENGIDNIPSKAFNNPNFIEIIYLGNSDYLTISNEIEKLSMEDINNIIQLKEIFYENYPKIKNNPLLNKAHGMDEDAPLVNDFFGIKTTNNNNYYYEPQEQINLTQFFHKNFFTSDYLRFISIQLVIFFINTNNSKTFLIDKESQLATIFAISNPKKYPIIINKAIGITKINFFNEAINIVKNQPKYLEQVVKIFSCYSIDNVLWKTISKNNYIQKNYPNFLELVIEHKMVYIKEKTQIDPQNINPKAAAATKEDDSPEVINAIISLGDFIDLIDSQVINFIRQDVSKYAPVITNIVKAESVNDITSETINFFASLEDIDEAEILLSRFDFI